MNLSIDKIRQAVELKSQLSDKAYGSYSHQFLQVSINAHSDKFDDFKKYRELASKNASNEQLAHEALTQASIIHEFKHYYDCFSTSAGGTLFKTYLIDLKEFNNISVLLKKHNLEWKLPLTDWVYDSNCPKEVKEFVSSHKARQLISFVYMGGLELPQEDGYSDEIWREVRTPQLGNFTFPVYPLKYKGFTKTKEVSTTNWCSVGFEALIEGSAQAFQRSLIESFCSKEVAEYVQKKFTYSIKYLDKDTNDEIKAAGREIPYYYNLTDFLITKFLRKKHGINTFNRGIITQLSDTALMESIFPDKLNMKPMRHPGQAFIHALSSSDFTNKFNPKLRDCVYSNTIIQHIIDSLLRDSDTPTNIISSVSSLNISNAIQIIESYVDHEVAIPLLKLRMQYGHSIFNDLRQFMKLQAHFPRPFATFWSNGVEFNKNLSPHIINAWMFFVILRSIYNQMMSGATVICCPRAKNLISGIEWVDFTMPNSQGNCSQFIRKRMCGTFLQGQSTDNLPKCVFYHVIQNLNL